MNTRKKVVKTVYHDEDDSEAEKNAGDFSDSGSEAEIFEESDSEEEEIESDASSGHEFNLNIKKPSFKPIIRRKKFAKEFIGKISKQNVSAANEEEEVEEAPILFSIRDLTDADKLLPSVLNLSESDSSSEDESPKEPKKRQKIPISLENAASDNDIETKHEYKDVFSELPDNSEEIAKKTFLELEQRKSKLEQTKAAVLKYTSKTESAVAEVKDLLALGEEVKSPSPTPIKKVRKGKKSQIDSESEIEDWEEVNEAKGIPQQGLQVVVDIPDACRKKKTIDIEMMMRRKINRVKKEHQVYMHKVHVLCWIGHGNYVSRVLNDQEILAAALSLVPSKECYPGERVDMKYVEQVATWYKDKFILKYDKNEDKYRPKAPPLKQILLECVKRRVVTSKKYLVFIFVSMLRALGLQCRIMFNFVTLPIKPAHSELCSLSTKPKDDKNKISSSQNTSENKSTKSKTNKSKCSKPKIPQVDGIYDYSSSSDSDFVNIMQLDGNDDTVNVKTRRTRANKQNKDDDVSPPKKSRASPIPKASKTIKKSETNEFPPKRTRKSTNLSANSTDKTNYKDSNENISENDDIIPPKRVRKPPISRAKSTTNQSNKTADKLNAIPSKEPRSPSPRITKSSTTKTEEQNTSAEVTEKQKRTRSRKKPDEIIEIDANTIENVKRQPPGIKVTQPKNSKKTIKENKDQEVMTESIADQNPIRTRKAVSNKNTTKYLEVSRKTKGDISKPKEEEVSKYFDSDTSGKSGKRLSLNRNRSLTANPSSNKTETKGDSAKSNKSRTHSAPDDTTAETSKYFETKNYVKNVKSPVPKRMSRQTKKKEVLEHAQRVSHCDLIGKSSTKNDVTDDLVNIIKKRVKQAKEDSKKGIVKGKIKQESDEDSDSLPVEEVKRRNSLSDDDFKSTKISPRNPKPSTSRKIDRRVISSDDDLPKNKTDVWCEVYVEELEQWIAVDVVKGKAHCTNELYTHATHPICYVVGWDNNNYLKDMTRRYVPQWNTVTRKQRAEPSWWEKAIQPWLGPRTARDCEEDDQLNRMQLEAPLPKSIGEYKNHPLYALKRHLLKFEAIYPPDAATLGFIRNEAVYSRDCVYVCRSRDTWLKEAKVVRLGEKPYKVVKARPKWDKLSNKLITDKPLEVFGPWQVQDFEPPVAENGIVPRNAYGNVELFKDCMLPKGTVHIKLPGLNRVAKKLNIDCAPAMTGFDFNGGWSHPVYDGFVVCTEFEEIITEAWIKDQEDIERREREKIEARVYGNWRRLIKGLLIRERLKDKYGFDEPSTSQDKKKSKGPRLVVKKK